MVFYPHPHRNEISLKSLKFILFLMSSCLTKFSEAISFQSFSSTVTATCYIKLQKVQDPGNSKNITGHNSQFGRDFEKKEEEDRGRKIEECPSK